MGKKIDVRIMKLNKWYLPKSIDLSNQTKPVILGCYDELEIEGLQVDIEQSKVHPFTAGYRIQSSKKSEQKKMLVDCSSQEQILFLNIGEGKASTDGTCFTEIDVEKFWSKQDSISPYLYLSMIHIDHSNKIRQALKKIKKVFKDNYLSYISFDYCDIVLFARNLSIGTFLEKIRELFVIDSDKNNEDNAIFDTFSMVGFWPRQSSPNLPPMKCVDETDKFQATINISIRDHKKFKQWYEKNIKTQNHPICYNIYGRHDVSIVNEDANTEWLMWIMEMLHKEKYQNIFWTFETFIKVKNERDIEMASNTSKYLDAVYKLVNNNLQREIDELREVVENSRLQGQDRYILPVYEVRDCICSIVKNSFAEEFVCCIYESFLHFVSYMKKEIKKLDVKSLEYDNENLENDLIGSNNLEDQIADSYDKYFVALNTLVNSTMHNERQFVQATAFNAVFYSVPPKIMAFYNAYIYRVKQILIDKDCKNQYSFLIYPSFSPMIFLEQISLDEAPPCDRILTVTINEESLYDIESVMYQMVHELAHHVGNKLRCRAERTQKINNILLKEIMNQCEIDSDTHQMLQQYLNINSKLYESEYLQYILANGFGILQMLADSKEFCEFSETYYHDKLRANKFFYDAFLESYGISKENQRAYVENYTKQYANIKCRDFMTRLKIMEDQTRQNRYKRYIELIEWSYRECYADLQMILVLAMNAEDYLNTFLVNLKTPVKDLLSQPEDLLRICTIFRIMTDCGLWKVPTAQDNEGYQILFKLISEYNEEIIANTDEHRIHESEKIVAILTEKAKNFDFGNGIRLKEHLSHEHIMSIQQVSQQSMPEPFVDLAAGLYEYLLDVIGKSLKEYSSKDKSLKIYAVRTIIKKLLTFEDATEVFNCVEIELDYYKQKGCKISSPKNKRYSS